MLTADAGSGQVRQLSATFTVPESPYGTNNIQLVRQYRSADPYGFSFTVTPLITVSPATVSPGTKVTLKGTGFPENDTGTLLFDGKDTTVPVTTSKLGSFTAEYTIPDVVRGVHTFKVQTEKLLSSTVVNTNFDITPGIRLDPPRPAIDTPLTIIGTGFASDKEITIYFDTIQVSKSPRTDVAGKFSYKFTVPETNEKNHLITVTDAAGNKVTWELPLENEPPAKSATLAPKDDRFGWFGPDEVTFSWKEVSDTSGVSYTVEVGNNLNFFPLLPGMRKIGITEPMATMTIQPGTYYWRVRAVDGAGNEGEWALSPYPFTVGFFPLWSLIAGALLFLVLFLLLIRSFTRRIKEYYY